LASIAPLCLVCVWRVRVSPFLISRHVLCHPFWEGVSSFRQHGCASAAADQASAPLFTPTATSPECATDLVCSFLDGGCDFGLYSSAIMRCELQVAIGALRWGGEEERKKNGGEGGKKESSCIYSAHFLPCWDLQHSGRVRIAHPGIHSTPADYRACKQLYGKSTPGLGSVLKATVLLAQRK